MPELTNIEQAILKVFNAVNGGLERADVEVQADAEHSVKICAYLVGNSVRVDVRFNLA